MRGSNHSGMRQFNERIVLQAIRHHGALPKADLARVTHLSTQTVANVVSRLMSDGLLLKQDRLRGRIGQPSVPLALNPDGAFSVGVQVGRRNLELTVVDFCGQRVAGRATDYDHPDPEQLFKLLEHSLRELRAELGERWTRVVGVGLTAPLSLHLWGELLGPAAAAALRRWEGVDLRSEVQARVDPPVLFAKDTTAACVAELLQGRGRSVRSFLYVFVGTFVGGSLVLDGRVSTGERGNAGAVGSIPVGLPGLEGKPAQLLQLASGGLLERALAERGLDPLLVRQPAVMQPPCADTTSGWLARASSSLAMTAVTATALLDIDAVVIDGSLEPALQSALTDATLAALDGFEYAGIRRPRLLAGEVGAHARVLGAALLPLHSLFFPDKDVFLKPDGAG
jgi:predicted NBD/HSP70 family sugar kinase